MDGPLRHLPPGGIFPFIAPTPPYPEGQVQIFSYIMQIHLPLHNITLQANYPFTVIT